MTIEVGDLYRDHAARIWRYARARVPTGADAEDVTSDVFMRAMRSVEGFDPARGSEAAWITGIARHAVADFWRRRPPEDPADRVSDRPSDEDPTAGVDRAEEIGGVADRLQVLSEREREAVALRFGAELSSPEIGELMGISPPAARMLVHRAVTKLREVIDDGR